MPGIGKGSPGAFGGVVLDGPRVLGGKGPGPSGSTTVVGAPSDVGEVGEVGVDDVVSPGLVSVVVGVVVVGVCVVVVGVRDVVVRGRSCTCVRGTQVYSGSGTNPGGTTAVSGAVGVCAAGW